MSEEEFWAVVDAAHGDAGSDAEARVDALRHRLAPLGAEALQEFQNRYDEMISRSYRWDLWGAAYLMNGGCSDDGFRYFRDWLISEGRVTFERALSEPDSLADLARQDYFELESFGYVALKLFEARGGGELERDFSTELRMPDGEQWSEDDLPTLHPRLAAKYGD
jgi:hypothetical protein